MKSTFYIILWMIKTQKKGNNNIASANKNALQLSPIYLELIKQLWDEKGEKSFSPQNFMNIIEKMNPFLKQGQAGDSKDFIIFILE